MERIFAFLLAVTLWVASGVARDYTPAEMPNVQIENRSQYVSDPGALLSPMIKAEVNRRLAELRKKTTVEMVVAIPPSIGDEEPAEWCEELFSDWKIGKKDRDNGVLLMISPESRCAFIMPGYGAEGVLTDIACNKIIHQQIIPAMKQNNLNVAVSSATDVICKALTDPAVAEELRSDQGDNFGGGESLDPEVIWNLVTWIAIAVFVASLLLFIYDAYRARKQTTDYNKARSWRENLPLFFWFGVLSLGAGMIFFLLALWRYRSLRTRPMKCPRCSTKMERLPEDKDNDYLNESQDLEERLNTVDYDVWKCPRCAAIERLPYKVRQKKYTECPVCHTIAMRLDSDVVLKQPTTRREGEGVRTYECQYCHHRKQTRYRIARKEDAAAAAAALGAAAASRGRGGGFGGGGFGGGFGGGMTGGGGAGGSW